MTTPTHPRPDFLSYPPPSPHDGTGPAVLVARDLAKSFGDVHAVDGVSLDVAAGTSLALTGPSGSGKSTLLHLLAGVLTPDTGSIQLDGAHVERLSERARSALRRDRVGFVFQQGFLLAELPAVENVALPLLLTGTGRRQAVAEAARWFPRLGIEGLERRRPGELSGGQAQRVALARALVGRPAVLFADEPTAALDSSTSDTVMDLLLGAARDVGVAVVVVTHDAAVAARCDRTLDLRDGRLARSAGQAPGDGRRTQAEVVR